MALTQYYFDRHGNAMAFPNADDLKNWDWKIPKKKCTE